MATADQQNSNRRQGSDVPLSCREKKFRISNQMEEKWRRRRAEHPHQNNPPRLGVAPAHQR